MINPVAFKIFNIEIRWYGIAYILSFFLADKLISFYIKTNKNTEINLNEKDDLMMYIIIGMLIGARLGEFIFYQGKILTKELLYIRNGGMSFHGGLIGVIIAILIYSYKKNKDPIKIGDLVVLVVPIGLFLGRLANYINQEIKGIDYWRFKEEVVLYEAFFEGIVLFMILNCTKNIQKRGKNTSKMMFYYAVFRGTLEFFKPKNGVYSLPMGQLLCLPMLIFSIYLKYFKKEEIKKINIKNVEQAEQI